MKPTHHDIDVTPILDNNKLIYINEPWIVDQYIMDYGPMTKEPEHEEDNIRIYVPIDLNAKAILRRLEYIIGKYGEATEQNEISFSQEVNQLIYQIEIYDQVHAARNCPTDGKHSDKAKELVKDFIALLENIPDGCAELFPFDTIDYLKDEYK